MEQVTYHCKQTKQEVKVDKGSAQHKTLKTHKMWFEGSLPTELKPKVKAT